LSTLRHGLIPDPDRQAPRLRANGWMGHAFNNFMPKGLYARALLIMTCRW